MSIFLDGEGFGKSTIGGKNGRVIYVTSLEDTNQEGSLRWAINQNEPRIIEFKIGGFFSLNDDIKIIYPNITINGSTAPHPVLIADATVKVETHEVIISYLRIRPGDSVALHKGRWKDSHRTPPKDAITITDSRNVIIDHCSTGWGSDELISVDGNSENVTVQWCLMAEPLSNPQLHIENGQPISHPFAALVSAKKVSYIKNLFAFFKERGPQFSPYVDGEKEAVNNYSYYYTESSAKITFQNIRCQYQLVSNYYENHHPNSKDIELVYSIPGDDSQLDKPKVYLNDNFMGNKIGTNNWDYVSSKIGTENTKSVRSDSILFDNHIDVMKISDVKNKILQDVGATLPKRDQIDKRVIDTINQENGSLVFSQDDVGGYIGYHNNSENHRYCIMF